MKEVLKSIDMQLHKEHYFYLLGAAEMYDMSSASHGLLSMQTRWSIMKAQIISKIKENLK